MADRSISGGHRPPRVLYLINGFKRGGAEKGLLHLLRHGTFAGCHLSVLSIITDQGAYVDDLRAHGADVRHLFQSRRMTVLHWLAAVPRFWLAMKRTRPDLVVLSLPQANVAGRVAAMFYPRATVASFEHNTHLAKRLYERLFRWTSFRVDWMLSDCGATQDEVSRRLYRQEPARRVVLPLVSFPDVRETADEGSEESGRPFTVISAARFTKVKNQEAIIRAARLLRDRGRQVTFRLFGEGDELEACQKLATSLAVDDIVSFPGFIPTWMTHPADLMLVPSRNEGLCIVALEALSQGIPVAGTRVGGLRDYGLEARIRFLDSATPAEIANCIAQLMDDPSLMFAMREAGAAVIGARYSDAAVGQLCARLSQEIHALVGGGGQVSSSAAPAMAGTDPPEGMNASAEARTGQSHELSAD